MSKEIYNPVTGQVDDRGKAEELANVEYAAREEGLGMSGIAEKVDEKALEISERTPKSLEEYLRENKKIVAESQELEDYEERYGTLLDTKDHYAWLQGTDNTGDFNLYTLDSGGNLVEIRINLDDLNQASEENQERVQPVRTPKNAKLLLTSRLGFRFDQEEKFMDFAREVIQAKTNAAKRGRKDAFEL